jgi:hypothetical protein
MTYACMSFSLYLRLDTVRCSAYRSPLMPGTTDAPVSIQFHIRISSHPLPSMAMRLSCMRGRLDGHMVDPT